MIKNIAIKTDRALGIHISESRISFALVKHDIGDIRLSKAGHISIPENAIRNGCIHEPAILGKALKTLLDKNHIRNRQAYISLLARPVIAQIIDLPKYVPSNMTKFVQSEIRHSAVLSGKESQYDFCGLGAGPKGVSQIFVAATNKEKINALLKTCAIAKVEPLSIELPSVAALRALYKKRINTSPEQRTMTVLVQKSMITLTVFTRGRLELIRNIDMQNCDQDTDDFMSKCLNEIDMIIQFYELEIDEGNPKNWQLVFQTETRNIQSQSIEPRFQDRQNIQICVCSDKTIYEDIPVKKCKSIEIASVTAIGLALKALEANNLGIDINLLPPEAMEITSVKKYCLVTANIAAVMLLIMFIIGGMVRVKLSNTENHLETVKQTNNSDNFEQLLHRQRALTQQVDLLNKQKEKMGSVYDDGNIIMWTALLDEIRKKTPKSLCIIHMVSTDNEMLSISGYGLSYKAIHLFADLLRDSEYIQSVQVTETNKSTQLEGYVNYSLDCQLISNEYSQSEQEEGPENAS